MLVIPSIDIHRGRCVQWVGGKMGTGKVYGAPVQMAWRWVEEGAEWLHVVDLDAALGLGSNFNLIAEILANVPVPVQVGGGIRDMERASELLGLGAERVILGTAAVRKPELVRELVEKVGGERVMVALDARGGRVVVKGWTEDGGITPLELAKRFEGMGVGSLLYTEVEVEGRMTGLRVDQARKLISSLRVPLFLSGGVGSLEDVRLAKEAGAAGLVVGMALYEGKFTLEEAKRVAA
ncbi:MAG: 1-(5-phosphoribosyl)-5-[(5-phosphoribosylamino)methylideneamino]imidazole-4-carboxamide isomerase [Candidatus Hadarchaeales archaeon]